MIDTTPYPRFRWFILLTISVSFAGLFVNMLGFAPVLPEIARDLHIGIGLATNLMAAFLFMSSLSLVGGGFLVDRFGIPFMMVLGGLFSAIPAVLMPVVGVSYEAVFIARLAQGTSAGFFFCLMSPIIALWFPFEEKGLAAGLMGAATSLGAALGVLAAPVLFLTLGKWQQMAAWLSVLSWLGLVLAFMTLVSSRQVRPPPMIPKKALSAQGSTFGKALWSPFTWTGIALTFFSAWFFHSLYNLVPAYFAAETPVGMGFGPMLSGKLMLSVMIAGMIGPVIGGLLQDKVFKGDTVPILFIGFALSAVFLYFIRFSTVCGSIPLLLVCLVIAGVGIQFVYPFIPVVVSKSYPLEMVGKMLGVWLGIGAFGGAAGLFVGGVSVAKTGNYHVAVTLIALSGVVGFIATFAMKRQRGASYLSNDKGDFLPEKR